VNTWIKHALGRILLPVALAASVLGAGTGVAQAATQQRNLGPNQGYNFNTYFWGRTQVCVQNVDPTNDGSYYWISSTSYGSGGLVPGQTSCMARSFAGFQIYVKNTSPRATLKVTFPIGP
jgi:hypothetical protein